MAGLDNNGLTIKRLPDIITEFESSLRSQYGNDLDLTENSLFGILNLIYAASQAENWEVIQAVYNSRILGVATGKALDDIATLQKTTRLQPTKSFGDLSLFGDNGAVIPIGTEFSDLNGNLYESTEVGNLNTGTSRTPISLVKQGGTGSTDDPSTTFQITINGDLYSYQSIWSPSIQEIIQGLQDLVPNDADYYIETIYDGNPEFYNNPVVYNEPLIGANLTAATNINVINRDESNPITVTVNIVNSTFPAHEANNTPFMGVNTKQTTFTDTVRVEALETGSIFTPLKTLSTITTAVTGLNTVVNESDIISGRSLETDEELRTRLKESTALNGNCTVPAITSKLNQIVGVSQAFLIENTTDGEYECMVVGGSDEDIAATIWNSKPATAKTIGTESVTFQDSTGRFQTVNFSRPESIYVWVKVYYSKYSEEAFPTLGEDMIEASVVDYGSTFDLGEDVIPKRFYGGIYSTVSGIQDLRVLVATSTDPLVEPDLINFTDDIITISESQLATFTNDRTEIIEE